MTNAWTWWEKSKATGMSSLPIKTGWILASEVSLKSKFSLCGTYKTQHISYEFKKIELEPAIIWKLVTCQRITSKRYSTSMGRQVSPRYGQVILVSGYPVLTAVNWSQHWCAICEQYQSSSASKLARKYEWTLVALWCGRTGRRCTVTWLPNFLGWVDLLTHGAPQARFARQSSAYMHVIHLRSDFLLMLSTFYHPHV